MQVNFICLFKKFVLILIEFKICIMKDNRKNRKLIYIREKNKFRTNKIMVSGFTKLKDDLTFDELHIEVLKLQEEIINTYKKQYNFKNCYLVDVNIEYGTEGDDFIRNIVSLLLKAELKIKKG